MTKKLLIAILLFLIGGYLVNRPESETVGSLIVIGTFLWTTYFLIIRPVINLVKRIFKKELATGEATNGSARQNLESSIDSIALKDPPAKTYAQAARKQTNHRNEEEKMDYLVPQHKLLLISVNKSLKDADIYDAVRCAWKLNVDRARGVDYVLAHHAGKVIGVFVATEWLPASDPAFNNLNHQADPTRWGFVGHVAPSEILLLYFGKQIPAELRKRGASNPIRFLDNTEDVDASNTDGKGPTSDAVTTEPTEPLGPANINLAFENVDGRVDTDGDFIASGALQTEQFVKKGEQFFLKSKVWATSDGAQLTATNESSDEACGGDELTLSTAFEKIEIDDGTSFSLNAQLDLYIVDQSKSIVIDTSSKGASIELDGFSVRINHFETDEDGDYHIHYTVLTPAPKVAAVRYAGENDDPEGYFREFLEPEEEFEEYMFGISEGDRVRIEVITMKPSSSTLSAIGSGVVSVLVPDEDEDFESENSNEDPETPAVFFATVEVTDLSFDDDLTLEAKKTALLKLSSELLESIRDNVDFDSRFFFKRIDGELVELNGDTSLEDTLSNTEVENVLNQERLGFFCLVTGNNHWRKSFLRVSEDFSNTLYVCGWNSAAGAIAVQGYSEGDFDTGIVCDPDETELYTGDAVLERFSIQESDFETDR